MMDWFVVMYCIERDCALISDASKVVAMREDKFVKRYVHVKQ